MSDFFSMITFTYSCFSFLLKNFRQVCTCPCGRYVKKMNKSCLACIAIWKRRKIHVHFVSNSADCVLFFPFWSIDRLRSAKNKQCHGISWQKTKTESPKGGTQRDPGEPRQTQTSREMVNRWRWRQPTSYRSEKNWEKVTENSRPGNCTK